MEKQHIWVKGNGKRLRMVGWEAVVKMSYMIEKQIKIKQKIINNYTNYGHLVVDFYIVLFSMSCLNEEAQLCFSLYSPFDMLIPHFSQRWFFLLFLYI